MWPDWDPGRRRGHWGLSSRETAGEKKEEAAGITHRGCSPVYQRVQRDRAVRSARRSNSYRMPPDARRGPTASCRKALQASTLGKRMYSTTRRALRFVARAPQASLRYCHRSVTSRRRSVRALRSQASGASHGGRVRLLTVLTVVRCASATVIARGRSTVLSVAPLKPVQHEHLVGAVTS